MAEDILVSGKADLICIGRAALYDPRWAWHAAEELGAETAYAPKMMAGHPKMRPMLFPSARRRRVKRRVSRARRCTLVDALRTRDPPQSNFGTAPDQRRSISLRYMLRRVRGKQLSPSPA